MNFLVKEQKQKPTNLDDSNLYWLAFKQATDDLLVINIGINNHNQREKNLSNVRSYLVFSGIDIKPAIMPGGSDSLFIRQVCIPIFIDNQSYLSNFK